MKTIKNLKESLDDLRTHSSHLQNPNSAEYKEVQRKAKLINEAILCLQVLNDNEEKVKAEYEKLLGKISYYSGRFDIWKQTTPVDFDVKNPLPIYEREVGLDKMRKQQRVLEFLLN